MFRLVILGGVLLGAFLLGGCSKFSSRTWASIQESGGNGYSARELRLIGRNAWEQGHYVEAKEILERSLEKDPDTYLAWNNIGWVYEELMEYVKMREAFGQALERNPFDYWNWIGACRASLYLGDVKKTKACIGEATEHIGYGDPKELLYLYTYLILYATDRLGEAEKALSKYLEGADDDGTSYSTISYWFRKLGFYEEAIEFGKLAFENKSTDDSTNNQIGWSYEKLVEYQKMEEAFAESIETDANNPWDYIGVGLAKLRKYEFEDALAPLSVANKMVHPDSYYADLYLGVAYILLGETEKSEFHWKEFLGQSPEIETAYRDIGRALWAFTEKYDLALRYLKKANEYKTPLSQWIDNNIGWVYYMTHQYAEMEAMFSLAVGNDPYGVWNYYGLSFSLIKQGKWNKASELIADFEEMEFLDSPGVRPAVLWEYYIIKGDKAKARSYLDQYLEQYRSKSEAHKEVGRFLYFQGEYVESIKHLEMSADLNAKNLKTWRYLGDSYLAVGKNQQARNCYLRADSLGQKKYFWSALGLAECAFTLGEREMAKSYLGRAKKLIANVFQQRSYSCFLSILNATEYNFIDIDKHWKQSQLLHMELSTSPQGVRVSSVFSDSLAQKFGFKVGDFITHVDGVACVSQYRVDKAIQAKSYGDSLDFTVVRNSRSIHLFGQIDFHRYYSSGNSGVGVQLMYDNQLFNSGDTVVIDRSRSSANLFIPPGLEVDEDDIVITAHKNNRTQCLVVGGVARNSNGYRSLTLDLSNILRGGFELKVDFGKERLITPLRFAVQSRVGAPQRLAILMGVTEYEFDKERWNSQGIINDVHSMSEVLSKQHGFTTVKIFNPTTKTLNGIRNSIRSRQPLQLEDGTRIDVEEGADLILYFSGHGFRSSESSEDSIGYIIPYGVDKNDLSGAVEMDLFTHYLKDKNPALHTIFILDSCYAALAGMPKASRAEKYDGCNTVYADVPGFHLIASSGANEQSWLGDKRSRFTSALVQILDGKEDDDGCLTMGEIDMRLRTSPLLEGKQAAGVVQISEQGGAPILVVQD